jgi:cytochrome c oxidase cbb3-type subunit III
VDGVWIQGGDPMAIYRVIDAGILDKGMPAWGPVLGSRKTAEVTAYVLSRQPAGGD